MAYLSWRGSLHRKKIIIRVNQTETKMNNNACIISIKAKISSNWVSQKSKNIIKLAAERLFWPGFITYFGAYEAWKSLWKVSSFLLHRTFLIESDTVDNYLFEKFAEKNLSERYFDLYRVFLLRKNITIIFIKIT